MVSEPALWDALCTRLADVSATFLQVQIAAGASVVQLFDSWAGSLSAADYAPLRLASRRAALAAVAATACHGSISASAPRNFSF